MMSVVEFAGATTRDWDSGANDAGLLCTVRHWNQAIAKLIGGGGNFDAVQELWRLLVPLIEFDVVRISCSGRATSHYVADEPDDKIAGCHMNEIDDLPPLAEFWLGFAIHVDGDVVQRVELCRYSRRSPFRQRDIDTLSAIEPLLALILCRGDDRRLSDKPEINSIETRLAALRECFSVSNRESEIIGFIVEGHSNYSISSHLDITVGTVKNHRKNIYRKLGISSQSELFSLVFAA